MSLPTTSLILAIEPLSRKPNAIVTEIAALSIAKSDSGYVENDSLLLHLNIAQQLADYRDFEAETLQFHAKNRSLPLAFTGTEPLTACMTLGMFIEKHQPRTVWIWGKDFDRPILEDLFAQHRLPLPWEYWRTACARDAWKLAYGDEHKPAKRNHKAIDDCRDTARDLYAALSELKRIERL